MANSMLGYGNYVDASAVSHGGWLSSLPVTNLQNRTRGKVARSVDTDPGNTRFAIRPPGVHDPVRAISLANINFSLGAKVRITGGNKVGVGIQHYDSGWVSAWGAVYAPNQLQWEDSNWWGHKYSETERLAGTNWTFTHVLPQKVYAPGDWQVDVDDPANPDAYVQIGRALLVTAWQPVVNISYPTEHGWENKTVVQEARSGAEYIYPSPPFRTARVMLDWMSVNEAFGHAFEIQRRSGIDQEVLYVYDPADTLHASRRSFSGRLRKLSPIEHPMLSANKTVFEVKEQI